METRQTLPPHSSLRRAFIALVAAIALSGRALPAHAQPLRRDLASYFIFALRNADLKNISVQGPCNVGVNCAQASANSFCGVVDQENVLYADGSQIAGDIVRFSKPGANVYQVFRNLGPALTGVTIRDPGSAPDGTSPLVPLPILGDLDGDGTPSCVSSNGGCVPDYGDIAVACGFPDPFPACAPADPVKVLPNGDCMGAPDTTPGNGRCDLAPGAYGDLVVSNGAAIDLAGGSYAFCSLNIGKSTTTTTSAASVVSVSGEVHVNNGARLGQQCGDLVVDAAGQGGFTFGRNSTIVGRFCAPERTMALGHDNDLTGQFVGDVVRADGNDVGHCCGGSCSCYDAFSPSSAHPGDTITITSGCDLTNVTAVTICGVSAPIVSKASGVLEATVPAVAAGACPVAVQSPAGTFVGVGTLTVL
ncbi:MAG TPA: hypothetical protein VGR62_12000 [Candidatus Binatia bacterium]|nr:hypothetical protein [Candidatus Binatia bacterium]